MGKIYQSIHELIGNTPLLEAKQYRSATDLPASLLVKLEYFNPNGSVKDRTAANIILDAERSGKLKPGGTIVEVTSGNTGIALAALAASKGYQFISIVQDNVSEERFKIITAFGGKVKKLSEYPAILQTLMETGGDFVAACKKFEEVILPTLGDVFFSNQGFNPANVATHYETTGKEIWEDTAGEVEIVIATVGTGGTISGTAKYLKEKNPAIQIIGVEPGPQSLPSRENPDPEGITGVHPFSSVPKAWLPDNVLLEYMTSSVLVETAEAYAAARLFAETEGILVGISSGAALHAATLIAKKAENAGKKIVTILPDTGLNYLSTPLFEGAKKF